MAEKEKAEVAAVTAEQAEKLGPQAIVFNNARILVHAELDEAQDLIKKSMAYMDTLFFDEKDEKFDFRQDAKALIGVQLQLASLSLAIEYWLKKIQTNKIKVYGANDMPKA